MAETPVSRPHRRAGAWATVLALFGALLLLVPVLLLPVSTAVPAANWISLLIADLVVIGWLVARRRHGGVRPLAVGGVAIVAVAAVIASQVLAATPPITDADGREPPGRHGLDGGTRGQFVDVMVNRVLPGAE